MKTKIRFLLIVTILFLVQCKTASKKANMEQNKNKEIVARFYNEALNKGNLDLLNDLMTEDFIDHNAPPSQLQGIKGIKNFLKMVTTAYPDLNIVLEETIAEGNKVVARLTITGTQSGVFMGTIPPSNKRVKWTGIDIIEIQGDKIIGRWSERNLYSMMIQIGAIQVD
ncbi:MAG: ester cyclase [Cytophagales bacterium]|nr:ester cyclase [Cytophagales bacterium]